MVDGKISVKQLQSLLVLNILSAQAVIIPGAAAGFAKNDGWVAIVGATAIALIYTWLINLLAAMFPNDSFSAYSKKIAGAFIGFLLTFGLAIWIMLSAATELRVFAEIIKEWLLYKTPIYITCAAMAAICAYASFNGLRTRANVAEMLIYIVFIPIIAFLLTACLKTDLSGLLPVFTERPENIAIGSVSLSFAFRSVVFAALVYPMMKKSVSQAEYSSQYAKNLPPSHSCKAIRAGQYKAVLFSGGVLALLTAVTSARFGANYTAEQLWPVLKLMDTINLPGNFLERQDAYVLGFWMLSAFISISAGLYFSSFIFSEILWKRNRNFYLAPCCAFVFIMAITPENILNTIHLGGLVNIYAGAVYLAVLPLLLFVTAKVRGLGTEEKR